MKNLITILFLFLGFSAFSQNPITTPRIKIIDRTGIDTTTVANQGQIVFDATDDKFRFNDGNGWFSFLKEGATLTFWPLSGTGTTTDDVTIDGNNNLTFDNNSWTFGSRISGTGNNSMSVGDDHVMPAANSFAAGYGHTINNGSGTAPGTGNTVSGDHSIATG